MLFGYTEKLKGKIETYIAKQIDKEINKLKDKSNEMID